VVISQVAWKKKDKKTKAAKRAHTISTLPIQLSGEPKLN